MVLPRPKSGLVLEYPLSTDDFKSFNATQGVAPSSFTLG